ncbi:MAG: 50S ribosomal protein L5 [Phycisphaerales bacterium]
MAKNKSNKPDKAAPATQAAAAPREGLQRLRKRYLEDARAEGTKQFEVTNPMAMPVRDRVVLNVNMGRFLDGPKIPPNVRATVIDTLTQITGQKPVVVKAKKSVSNFKVREGMETAAMVTLRGDRMWDFLDRFINLATPRIKDFRGLSDTSFDRAGNYSIGLTEQGVFPEINMANVTFTHGMNINFVFRNSDKAKSRTVLEALGMPFRKPPAPKKKAS